MKFGFFRSGPGLPAADKQIEILSASGCEDRVVEVESGAQGARHLDRFLGNLDAGDVVCIVSLDVFDRTLEELTKLLRNLAELSVGLCIASRNDADLLIAPTAEVVNLLQLLSTCESRARTAGQAGQLAWYGRPFLPADEFTAHQREHALKLYAEGLSLRAIGLIFRTSPGEVLKVVSEGRRPPRVRPAGGAAQP